jgi:hypothetical protein
MNDFYWFVKTKKNEIKEQNFKCITFSQLAQLCAKVCHNSSDEKRKTFYQMVERFHQNNIFNKSMSNKQSMN